MSVFHLTDRAKVDAYISSDRYYNPRELRRSLWNHPNFNLDMLRYFVCQKRAYQALTVVYKKHSDAWCEPTWEAKEYALMKGVYNQRYALLDKTYRALNWHIFTEAA